MSRCTATESGVQCASEGPFTLNIGCIHEHMGLGEPVCGPHLARVRQHIADGSFRCDPCRDSAEPHRCPLFELSPAPA